MNKPKKYEARPYYDLLEVLDYIDTKIPRFKDKIWDKMCDEYYINNDTITSLIDFQDFVEDDMDETIKEGVDVLFKEFPDIKNEEVDFKICW